jgi:beta-lactamase class A
VRKKTKPSWFARLRLLFFSFLILIFVLPSVFTDVSSNLILNRFKNSSIQIPDNMSFINNTEYMLSNENFLGLNFIGDVYLKKPEMSGLFYSRPMPNLTARLRQLTSANSSIKPGILVWDYLTGGYVDINGSDEYPTASIVKLPILCELFKRVEMGLINLDQKFALTPYYVTDGSGYLQYKPVGSSYTVAELARLMIQESDNSATNMLLSAVGGVNGINRAIRKWGFANTHMSTWLPDLNGTNVSTPRDMARILYNLDNPDFLDLSSRAKIVDILSNVKNRYLIQAGLPDNAQFIHKTGDIGTMLGDAGVVIMPSGRKYIVVIMVERPWNSFAAKQFIIDASKIIYNSFEINDL